MQNGHDFVQSNIDTRTKIYAMHSLSLLKYAIAIIISYQSMIDDWPAIHHSPEANTIAIDS